MYHYTQLLENIIHNSPALVRGNTGLPKTWRKLLWGGDRGAWKSGSSQRVLFSSHPLCKMGYYHLRGVVKAEQLMGLAHVIQPVMAAPTASLTSDHFPRQPSAFFLPDQISEWCTYSSAPFSDVEWTMWRQCLRSSLNSITLAQGLKLKPLHPAFRKRMENGNPVP